ncbi:hypothetical protein [Rhodococcus sp. LB1]|jgi:hypothetical protein|uniref:hypothetical protein n=1 Tax=Rhodococcus sp. LB1 TaxID=1807499 RepID=UPI000B140D72|nr:hypothetical protein [Rhodococcus sp. LB1]
MVRPPLTLSTWWTQLVDIEHDTLGAGLGVRAAFPTSGPAKTDEYVPAFTPAQDE